MIFYASEMCSWLQVLDEVDTRPGCYGDVPFVMFNYDWFGDDALDELGLEEDFIAKAIWYVSPSFLLSHDEFLSTEHYARGAGR